MKQKKYIAKIVSYSIGISALLLPFSAASANTGYLDKTAQNLAKVCHDVTCKNPPPGIIDFKKNNQSPIIVDSASGISGIVWGGELGWIHMNSDKGKVYFADPKTGWLAGNAWSETSGFINFAVTGQKISIDPQTGEFNGWAWASGPYGGWIKFDCQDPSACLRTTWRPAPERSSVLGSPVPSSLWYGAGSYNNLKNKITKTAGDISGTIAKNSTNIFKQTSKTTANISNTIRNNSIDILGQISAMANNVYGGVRSGATNFSTQMVQGINEFYNTAMPYLTGTINPLWQQIKNIFQSLTGNALNAMEQLKDTKLQPKKTNPHPNGFSARVNPKATKTNEQSSFLNEMKEKTNNFFGTVLKK